MREEGLVIGHFLRGFVSANFRGPKRNPELVCKFHVISHTYHEALPKVNSKLPPKLSFFSFVKLFSKHIPSNFISFLL
jgi:hypothetical protein